MAVGKCDFTTGMRGYNGIGSVLLDNGQIAVVGVLQRQIRRFEQIFSAPAGRQHRPHQQLTNFAPVPLPVAANQLLTKVCGYG